MPKSPDLYTQEILVFAKGVQKADKTAAVTVYDDTAGHHALADGNHRARKALEDGTLNDLPRTVIGKLEKDISADPYYRPIAALKVIGK